MIDSENIDIDVVLSDTELEIDADLHLLEQVLINLLKNAMDAVRGKHGAKIVLAGTHDAFGRPMLRVSDNGVGIPAADVWLHGPFTPSTLAINRNEADREHGRRDLRRRRNAGRFQ